MKDSRYFQLCIRIILVTVSELYFVCFVSVGVAQFHLIVVY